VEGGTGSATGAEKNEKNFTIRQGNSSTRGGEREASASLLGRKKKRRREGNLIFPCHEREKRSVPVAEQGGIEEEKGNHCLRGTNGKGR